jgi:hypothetical protein
MTNDLLKIRRLKQRDAAELLGIPQSKPFPQNVTMFLLRYFDLDG